jgi:hypothetical protein
MQFLVYVPSFEDLDRLDGIHFAVPSYGASMTMSAWQTVEVPHTHLLEKVWLHVEGVPWSFSSPLSWFVGRSLLGRTVDVDLISLRRRALVRIQVAMVNTKVLGKPTDDALQSVVADAVVKFKSYASRFRREPADFVPEPDFIPQI